MRYRPFGSSRGPKTPSAAPSGPSGSLPPPVAATPKPGRLVGGTRSTIAGSTLHRVQLDDLADAGQHLEIAHFMNPLASSLRERRISESSPDSLSIAKEYIPQRVSVIATPFHQRPILKQAGEPAFGRLSHLQSVSEGNPVLGPHDRADPHSLGPVPAFVAEDHGLDRLAKDCVVTVYPARPLRHRRLQPQHPPPRRPESAC